MPLRPKLAPSAEPTPMVEAVPYCAFVVCPINMCFVCALFLVVRAAASNDEVAPTGQRCELHAMTSILKTTASGEGEELRCCLSKRVCSLELVIGWYG